MHPASQTSPQKTQNGGNARVSVTKYLTDRVPVAHPEETLGTLQQRIRSDMHRLETLNYIYVLDGDRLVNVFSIKELYIHPPETLIRDIAGPKKIHAVGAGADRERAAYLALRYNIKAIPVLEHGGRFLGVMSSDAIQKVLYTELREDLMRFAGIRHTKEVAASVLQTSLWVTLRHRLPWLLIGMAGGMLGAGIIDLFEETLRQYLLLAAFIPLVVFMSNAVALQMTAFLIRDLSLERDIPFRRYFFRELQIACLIAIVCSPLLLAAVRVMHGDARTSMVLGLGLFCGILSSTFTGVVIPYAFHRMKLDPADASGPVGTIVQDNMSIVLYFGIAAWML